MKIRLNPDEKLVAVIKKGLKEKKWTLSVPDWQYTGK